VHGVDAASKRLKFGVFHVKHAPLEG
jgi:hypothetical protein